jgi:hypothetical protein
MPRVTSPKCRLGTFGVVDLLFSAIAQRHRSDMANEVSELKKIADRYVAFATDEARGQSAIYEMLALTVAGSNDVLGFLATLPAEKRQPNLFLAVVRHLFGVPDSGEQLVDTVRHNHQLIRELMLCRTTQTNEPARCAVLLPLLARLPQPLALLEVGASAGLCLLPDRYGYDYGTARIVPPANKAISPPVFECHAIGAIPLPVALPTIIWRAGIDLSPIDANSAAETAWLETLIWPGLEKRVAQFRAALAVAQAEPPRVVKGNLLTDLDALIAQAPDNATLVIFHTAVLGYEASRARREHFAQQMRRSRAVWISNEIPSVFPAIAKAAPPRPRPGLFLLAINGTAVAWTGPHGESINWFGVS